MEQDAQIRHYTPKQREFFIPIVMKTPNPVVFLSNLFSIPILIVGESLHSGKVAPISLRNETL